MSNYVNTALWRKLHSVWLITYQLYFYYNIVKSHLATWWIENIPRILRITIKISNFIWWQFSSVEREGQSWTFAKNCAKLLQIRWWHDPSFFAIFPNDRWHPCELNMFRLIFANRDLYKVNFVLLSFALFPRQQYKTFLNIRNVNTRFQFGLFASLSWIPVWNLKTLLNLRYNSDYFRLSKW